MTAQKEGRTEARPEIKPMSQINPPGGTTLPGQPKEVIQ